ncbi:MAG: acyl-CoA thioesterase [Acidimicrobiia bacterium]
MDLEQLFALVPHGPDTFVGAGGSYPWGGLYGGHIVAQALRAAAETVEPELIAHSLRAYFIRRGDASEPVRYEVDRIRNGRSFSTRRVVARQAIGAILNLEASFQRAEDQLDLAPVTIDPAVPRPELLASDAWTPAFDRRWVPRDALDDRGRDGRGRTAAWMRASGQLGDDQLLQRCALAYISDDLPADTVMRAHPEFGPRREQGEGEHGLFVASLDHTIWFHAPLRADEWHLYDFSCHRYVGGRGLAIGHVFDESGIHAATVAQEALVRDVQRPARP